MRHPPFISTLFICVIAAIAEFTFEYKLGVLAHLPMVNEAVQQEYITHTHCVIQLLLVDTTGRVQLMMTTVM